MKDTIDAIILPTGERTSGKGSFTVSREVVKEFKKGKYGCIFVTGGYDGFAKIAKPKYRYDFTVNDQMRGDENPKDEEYTRTEGEAIVEYLVRRGIPQDKIFLDDRALEGAGKFSFPLVKPIYGNPEFWEFDSMKVFAEKGNIGRIKDYIDTIMFNEPSKTNDELLKYKIGYHPVNGKDKEGIFEKFYNTGAIDAIETYISRDKQKRRFSEATHEFLINRHPFYSLGWFEKTPNERKMEIILKDAGWRIKSIVDFWTAKR